MTGTTCAKIIPVPFQKDFEKLGPGDEYMAFIFGILLFPLALAFSGWKPIIEACIALGIMGTAITVACSSATETVDNAVIFAVPHAAVSFFILFIPMKPAMDTFIFWSILGTVSVVIFIVAAAYALFMSFIFAITNKERGCL
jgi:hypothetical protein